MVVKVYISGISGNKEVKKRQQRVLMILDSKQIPYEVVDITEPGKESEKDNMQTKSTSSGATVNDTNPRHPLPPQLFNDTDYCGDYDQFDLANELDTLEVFLKVELPKEEENGTTNETENSKEEQPASENITENSTEKVTEETTEKSTEDSTEKVSENDTEKTSETVTEEVIEKVESNGVASSREASVEKKSNGDVKAEGEDEEEEEEEDETEEGKDKVADAADLKKDLTLSEDLIKSEQAVAE